MKKLLLVLFTIIIMSSCDYSSLDEMQNQYQNNICIERWDLCDNGNLFDTCYICADFSIDQQKCETYSFTHFKINDSTYSNSRDMVEMECSQ